MKQHEAYAFILALCYQVSCPTVSGGVFFWQSACYQEGNPDSIELHKATSATLKNFPLDSYTSPKVVTSPGAVTPAPWGWYSARLCNHLC